MNLNHIDIPTTDVSAARSFFEKHFGFRRIFARDDGLTVLLDEDNFALTLSPLSDSEKLHYPSGVHIGFNVDSEHELYELHGRLAAATVPIIRHPADIGGALIFQCHAGPNLGRSCPSSPRLTFSYQKSPWRDLHLLLGYGP